MVLMTSDSRVVAQAVDDYGQIDDDNVDSGGKPISKNLAYPSKLVFCI